MGVTIKGEDNLSMVKAFKERVDVHAKDENAKKPSGLLKACFVI
jgi:hypothetical protein